MLFQMGHNLCRYAADARRDAGSAGRARYLDEAAARAESHAAERVEELRARLVEAEASASRMSAASAGASAAADEAEKRCQAAQREVARLASDNRAAIARAAALEAAEATHRAEYGELAREASAARAAAHSHAHAASEASAGRAAAELRVEELRDALRHARGDVTSAAAAAMEMEKHMSASQRSAAEAVMQFKVGSAGKELLSTRLRERETEIAELAVELREERAARLRDQEDAAARLESARCARGAAEAAVERCRLELSETRAELTFGADRLAASAAAPAAAEEVAGDHATAAAALRARLFPDGNPDDDDDISGGGGVRHEVTVLRASLLTVGGEDGGGGGGDDSVYDVTEAVRARLAETMGERLVIKVSENLRDVLGAQPPLAAGAGEGGTLEWRLIVEYETTTTRFGGDNNNGGGASSSSSSSSPPLTAEIVVGGVGTPAPFPASSLWIEAKPAAADYAARASAARVGLDTTFHNVIFVSQNTVQLTTAGTVSM
jgi:hypothetical protein